MMVAPGQGYTQQPKYWTGYDDVARGDVRSFLLQRYHATRQMHSPRIQLTEEMLQLWISAERAVYGQSRKQEDEERHRISKPWRLTDMIVGLVWSKPPMLTCIPLSPDPVRRQQAASLERNIITMFESWKLFRPCKRGVFWSVLGGVGPMIYSYNPLAMDDEPLMDLHALDPRQVVWKESSRLDGTVDYAYVVGDEEGYNLLQKYGTCGTPDLDKHVMMNPLHKVRTYTYWAVERGREGGKPYRAVISGVFTDSGWLRYPQIMDGYTHMPLVLMRGNDYPVEHIERAFAYMPALWPIRDELIAEARILSAVLTNAKYHTNPAYNLTSTRADIEDRVKLNRGAANHLYPDEKVEPALQATTQTQDLVAIMQHLGSAIEQGSIPDHFMGDADLKDISGISLSMASTGPLIRYAGRQDLIQDALEQLIPPMVACLGRHAYSDRRMIRVAGPDPKSQERWYSAVMHPLELLDPDIRVKAQLSSSLPRDAINEIMTVDGLARNKTLSKRLARRHALKLLDLEQTDPDAEEQQIWRETMHDFQFQMALQQGPQAPPSVEPEYVPQGFQRSAMGTIEPDPFHQPTPEEPLIASPLVERGPSDTRLAPSQREPLTGRGSEPTTNPLLLGRRGRQMISQTGAMLSLQPRRGGRR